MRSITVLSLLAAAATSVSAVPNGQIAFMDPVGQEASAILANSKDYVESLVGSAGNVAEKGASWLKAHMNDPRFLHVSHAAFPEYRLRLNTKKPSLCDPDVVQHSGYLDIGDKKHLFFWFFESRNNPKKDPLTLWLNGGPGCSSTTGLLFELGPCSITNNGTGTVFNPYSWTEHSNMIFLDQPVNVGFSYTEGSQVLTTPEASKDVYAFLQLFMKTFPEYSANDFHISGESYAGTYIPNFASYIHKEQKSMEAKTTSPKEQHAKINMKSVLIGNGLSDPYYQFASVPEYACAPSKTAFVDESGCTTMKNKVSTCQRLETYCYDNPSRFTCVPAALYCWGMYAPLQATGRNLYDIRKTCNRDGEDGPLCYKELGWIESWMNRPEVKEELGAPAEMTFQSCNMDINRGFLMTGDSQHNSAALLPPLLADGIRVLIYAGNQDSMCNWLGNKEWFVALDNIFAKDINGQKDRDYKVNGKFAGRVISAGEGAGNYTFLEADQAGHMLPTDQPEVALDMFKKWLANKEF